DAKNVLLKAGYTLNSSGKLEKGGKVLEISIIGLPSLGQGPEYIGARLNMAGITAKTRVLDQTAFTTAYRSGDFEIYLLPSQSASPAPGAYLPYYSGKTIPQGGLNVPGIQDPI